jgi:hypothetical protein
MLSSTVEQVRVTVSDQIKKFGYTALSLALKQLIINGQHKLAAMIIVALCLAPRRNGVENSGVRKILCSISLMRVAQADGMFMYELRDQTEHCANKNKAEITLQSFGWFRYSSYWPGKRTPWLQANDSCIYFNSTGYIGLMQQGFQHCLCDHAGDQRRHYFPHFRMVWQGPEHYSVRFIGKQLDRDSAALSNSKELPNGYYEYLVPAETVLYGFGEKDGRTLADILEPGVWYNYYFQPDTELDLVDHEAEAALAGARQNIANLIMKAGQMNG